jgi:hypothetical protein
MIALVKTKEIFTSKHLNKKLVFLELLHRLQHQNNKAVEHYFFALKQGEEQGYDYFFRELYQAPFYFALTFLDNTGETLLSSASG